MQKLEKNIQLNKLFLLYFFIKIFNYLKFFKYLKFYNNKKKFFFITNCRLNKFAILLLKKNLIFSMRKIDKFFLDKILKLTQ